MARPTGLSGLFFCYFAIHHRNGERILNRARVFFYGVIPVVAGTFLTRKIGIPEDSYTPLIVAVLAVLAAVLVGLLPLIHSVIGQAEPDRKYSVGEKEIAQQELDRIQTLQDLHAAISFAVIVLVVGLVTCMVFPFLGTIPPVTANAVTPLRRYQSWEQYIALVFTGLLYTVAVSTSLTFFDIAKGIFEAVESYAESLKGRIRKNIGGTPEQDQIVEKK